MRKIILTAGLLFFVLARTWATALNYLVFTLTDGTTQSIAAAGLDITFSDGTLCATDGTNALNIPLTSLAKMEFAEEEPTGIGIIRLDNLTATQDVIVCDLAGRRMPQGKQLPKGTYIMTINGQRIKVQTGK